MMRGSTAGARCASDACQRLLAVFLAPFLAADEERGRPVFTPEALPR